MSNNKQSSVEWFYLNLTDDLIGDLPPEKILKIHELKEQAKAMHKKEILESYRWGRYDSDKLVMSERFYRQQYYEQTFGGNK